MSKKFWFYVCLAFSLALITFVILCYYVNKNNKKATPSVVDEFIKEKENLEAFKKFGIEQSDDTIKAIMLSIHNVCAVKDSFVNECVEQSLLKSDNFPEKDKEFTKVIMKFNESFNTHIFKPKSIKKVFEEKDDKYKDLVKFFTNFVKDTNLLGDQKTLEINETKFYTTIKSVFKKDSPTDFEFTGKQEMKFGDKKYSVFDYVYFNFIAIYRGLPKESN